MAKTGRNDPCPCGSGLRFKQCCLSTRKIRSSQQPIADAAQPSTTTNQTAAQQTASQRAAPSADTAHILAAKQQFFERWKDEPLKSLGGLTPRQAASHARAWRKLEVVLKVKEHAEREEPLEVRFDFDALRRELGIQKK